MRSMRWVVLAIALLGIAIGALPARAGSPGPLPARLEPSERLAGVPSAYPAPAPEPARTMGPLPQDAFEPAALQRPRWAQRLSAPEVIPPEGLADWQIPPATEGWNTLPSDASRGWWLEPEPEGLPPAGFGLSDAWRWQIFPAGLLYRSYLADVKAARLSSVWHDGQGNSWWDISFGSQIGLLRYGTLGGPRPQGWQLDIEGVAFPQLDQKRELNLVATDFRAGGFLTFAQGNFEFRFGEYHLSSHAGDEFLLSNPGFTRINFSRDTLVLGAALRTNDAWRFYSEMGYAPWLDSGADHWEFLFGTEYSPLVSGIGRLAPFLAVHGHLREEVDYGGALVVQTGVQYRGDEVGRLMRFGFEYYNGKSRQWEFFRRNERHVGLGVWYDF